MSVPDPGLDAREAFLRTLSFTRPRPGVTRMTSLVTPGGTAWDEETIADWLEFPGVPSLDYTVRRFDTDRGILDVDFTPSIENTIMQRWLGSVRVGSTTPIGGPRGRHLPNFGSGRRVLLFADEASVPAVHAILQQWPASSTGTVWVDTPHPAAVGELPVVDGVGVISFHVGMGFDPLVTAARRCEMTSRTTVWAAGERRRMDAIRATCRAAGLSADDTRVFGYW
ncbi:siderophore-interacting protein [Rhodococcoides kyotonense]|uniref:Siderophore-interacting FAD-binding domain-containing protein n=1 Tax=Rhodococcoides kyotonense TaxID=398843 RepID=A0A239F6H9_9NOCA|nr:siderophore-interacting protein [Rhodococcus kyotonensis]SNS52650.1 Siderophore-interacting FAD-binding domain-containing protein [Rhodococcus kyotonensis]